MKKNQVINDGITAIIQAIQTLSKQELKVVSFYHNSFSKPIIEIKHHPKCDQFIAMGRATYYHQEGHYRFAQFKLNGCLIMWKERDNSHLH